MKKKIEDLLKEKLKADRVEVRDDSPQHAGHAQAKESGGGHYAVLVVSDLFKGKSLVERHRMVYDALAELKGQIHALGIKAMTCNESA